MYLSLIGLALLGLTWGSSDRSPIWPQPVSVEVGNGTLWLDQAVTATFRCGDSDATEIVFTESSPNRFSFYKDWAQQTAIEGSRRIQTKLFGTTGIPPTHHEEKVIPEQDILRQATRKMLIDLHGSNFVPWKFHKRHAHFEPDAAQQYDRILSLTILQAVCPDQITGPSSFYSGDERYQIEIKNGTARIETTSSSGTLRAMESFKQLFYRHSSIRPRYTPYAPVRIEDRPLFRHRGVSLDIARNPFTPDDVMRAIDVMASTKMNRLHLHATDSQAWPLEIPSLPELAQKGAYHPQLLWSTEDLKVVQSHGDHRGVMVYVEIDMPGHTASIAQAYPNLIAAYNELDWSTFAAEPQSGQLKLNSSEVKGFLDQLFSDLLPRLNLHSSLYHLGGDEVNRKVHLLDETVRSEDFEVLKPLIQQIFNQTLAHVSTYGLRAAVWEEMVLDWDLDLPKSTLVQVWRNSERIEAVLKKGLSIIFGDYHHWYLDCGFGQFLDPYPQNRSPSGVPFNTSGGQPSRLERPYLDYCNPYHNWRDIWAFNPLANVSKDLHKGIEGGEVLMWSEQTDSVDLDFKLWPRAAAAAEVLWAGPRNQDLMWDATWRLGMWRERMVVDHGVKASPVTMTWCLMEGGCEY